MRSAGFFCFPDAYIGNTLGIPEINSFMMHTNYRETENQVNFLLNCLTIRWCVYAYLVNVDRATAHFKLLFNRLNRSCKRDLFVSLHLHASNNIPESKSINISCTIFAEEERVDSLLKSARKESSVVAEK